MTGNFANNGDFRTIEGIYGFTSPPKEDMLRIFSP
jgi:hypothetical protein